MQSGDEAPGNRLDQIVGLLPDLHDTPGQNQGNSTETRSSLLNRLRGSRLISDDNMGTEWQ